MLHRPDDNESVTMQSARRWADQWVVERTIDSRRLHSTVFTPLQNLAVMVIALNRIDIGMRVSGMKQFFATQ